MVRSRLLQAARYWVRRPRLALAVVGISGLGVGATVLVFSVFDALMLRDLPFDSPDRLVAITSVRGDEDLGASWLDYVDWREERRVLADAAAYFAASVHVRLGGAPVPARGATVTTNLLPSLGIAPAVGPGFAPPGSPLLGRQVVVSDGFASRHLGGPREAVGRAVEIEGQPYEICAVLPPGPAFPPRSDLWIALEPLEGANPRSLRGLEVVARLASGASVESAAARLRALAGVQARTFPSSNAGVTVAVTPFADEWGGGLRLPVTLLLAACGLLLVVTAANLAGLLLVQMTERLPEVAIRRSLGASRSGVATQLVTECMLACCAGGAIGLLVATGLLAGPLPAWLTTVAELPDWAQPRADLRLVLCSLVLSLAVAACAALLPVLATGSGGLFSWLREAGRSGLGLRASRGLSLLAGAQMAMAVVLLVGAGLLASSLTRLTRESAGFDLDVHAAALRAPVFDPTGDRESAAQLRRVVEALAALPGVDGAALNTDLPLTGTEAWHRAPISAEGVPADPSTYGEVNLQRVSPGYFDTLRIRLRSGRDFTPSDDGAAPLVAVVSSTLAERLWPGRDPIGLRLGLGERAGRDGRWWRVVAVAEDVRHQGLARGPSSDVSVPFYQSPSREETSVVVRSGLARHELADMLARLRDRHAPTFVLSPVYRVGELRSRDLARPRLLSALNGTFAAFALLLTACGISGVLSCWERNHRRELALRSALGAPPALLARLVLRRGLTIAGAGAAAGMVVAPSLMMPLVANVLYPGGPGVGWALVAGAAVALLVAVATMAGPALRAARLDAATVLGR